MWVLRSLFRDRFSGHFGHLNISPIYRDYLLFLPGKTKAMNKKRVDELKQIVATTGNLTTGDWVNLDMIRSVLRRQGVDDSKWETLETHLRSRANWDAQDRWVPVEELLTAFSEAEPKPLSPNE